MGQPLRVRPALVQLGLLALCGLQAQGQAAHHDHLIRLLERRDCRACRLQDADLVHADLRDAQLQQAQLQRANLGQAQLDGANLRAADLSFSSLQGASLRGADLRGARLEGADLRRADLSEARLDPGALARSHWQGAIGVAPAASSYAAMHNAGVEASAQGRLTQAEEAFNLALQRQPDAAITWLARGLTRMEQGNRAGGREDLAYAATLYEQQGRPEVAAKLRESMEELGRDPEDSRPRGGNGAGGALLQGIAGLVQALAPLAIRIFAPVAF
jgi:tetratricopeptide (TPR) repeat protein